jgi:hypothetical protein
MRMHVPRLVILLMRASASTLSEVWGVEMKTKLPLHFHRQEAIWQMENLVWQEAYALRQEMVSFRPSPWSLIVQTVIHNYVPRACHPFVLPDYERPPGPV